MKKNNTTLLALLCCAATLSLFSCKKDIGSGVEQQLVNGTPSEDFYTESSAPVQKRITHSINASVNGYLEALPASYSQKPNHKYPLIIFLHGRKGAGDGSFAELANVEDISIPYLIKQKKFPKNFIVGENTYQFIVISPQFKRKCWPLSWDVDDVVDFIIKKYRVDINRIYLCGDSMGGGGVWDYAIDHGKRLAAIAPFAGASWPTTDKGKKIAESGVPVWAFHNKSDPDVPAWYSIDYVKYTNKYNPVVTAKLTLFYNTTVHNCWNTAIDPSYKENNKNLYEWMLSHHR